MSASDKKQGIKAQLLGVLQNPTQLRVVVTGVVVVAAYAGIYLPLSSDMTDTGQKLDKERLRLNLVREVQQLRGQFASFKDRLPAKSDPNEWVQYLLGGMRQFPVKLAALKAEPSRDLGPYKAVVLRIELEGSFQDLNGLLQWLETNERLMRIDVVKIEPHRTIPGTLFMQLTVLGMMG